MNPWSCSGANFTMVPCGGVSMRLDLAFELSDLILQLAARGVECIS